MSEKHESEHENVITLECDYCMQHEPSPPFADGDECTMCYGKLRDPSVKTLEQQLAEVTAERDALAAHAERLTAALAREDLRDPLRTRVEELEAERDALKQRVDELQRLVDNATAGPGDHI